MKQFNQVLYLDDDADDGHLFEEAFKEIFRRKKFYYFETPRDFFSFLKSNLSNLHPLIFIDLNMPVKSGMECIKEIRASRNFSSLPVIIYTTSNRAEDIKSAYAAGANLYVQKPFTYDGIKKSLVKICELDWNYYNPKPDFEDFFLR